MSSPLDARPIIVAVAGPNGAGKSTFYEAFLSRAGLLWVNADEIARELGVDAYGGASLADALRRALVEQGQSFAFETVLSDPEAAKVEFLKFAEEHGYTVVLCFIGLESAQTSRERVALRVAQGGHDVPDDKLAARYPRTLSNLARAIQRLQFVRIFDNSDLDNPFALVAEFTRGVATRLVEPVPAWLSPLLPHPP